MLVWLYVLNQALAFGPFFGGLVVPISYLFGGVVFGTLFE